MTFDQIPLNISTQPDPFTLRVPDEELSTLKAILSLSRIGRDTWWNHQDDLSLGISSKWLSHAKDTWLSKFDWRQQERAINGFPNFYMTINDSQHGPIKMHFAALFSKKLNATPIVFMHGWPGSFLEYLPILRILSDKYTPETLPYHVIVPSLPGFGLSADIPIATEFTMEAAARIIHQLMMDLGFKKGYIAQGGDVGALLSAILLRDYEQCVAAHEEFSPRGYETDTRILTNTDSQCFLFRYPRIRRGYGGPDATGARKDQGDEFMGPHRMAYALEHGTRPATIGLALSSNPLAILAWIGEKFLEWPGIPIPLDIIISHASLYWFTSTIPSSLYVYRYILVNSKAFETDKKKPIGYSFFKDEFLFAPKAWAHVNYPNMTQYRAHDKGGHFPALELPEVLLQDVEDFVAGLEDLNAKL